MNDARRREVHPGRHRQQARFLRLHFLRERAVAGERHHPIARLHARDAVADRLDDARQLAAGRERQRRLELVLVLDDQDVRESSRSPRASTRPPRRAPAPATARPRRPAISGGPYSLQRTAFIDADHLQTSDFRLQIGNLRRRLARIHRKALARNAARVIAAEKRGGARDVLGGGHPLQRRPIDERLAAAARR